MKNKTLKQWVNSFAARHIKLKTAVRQLIQIAERASGRTKAERFTIMRAKGLVK